MWATHLLEQIDPNYFNILFVIGFNRLIDTFGWATIFVKYAARCIDVDFMTACALWKYFKLGKGLDVNCWRLREGSDAPVIVHRHVNPNISKMARYKFQPKASRINRAPENRFTEILVKT